MIHKKRESCRACGCNRLRLFLSLGPTPLANSFLHSEGEFASEVKYPLDVYFCEACSLMQLLDVISPEVLFRNYIYLTGTSDTIAVHNRKYSHDIVALLKLGSKDRVYEIGSNDGSLLKYFKPYGVKTLGIEPASNIAAVANSEGVETLNEFFNPSTAWRVLQTYGPAKAVIANNVLAHVDETRDFLGGCKQLLAKDGLAIIEVPYLRELIGRFEYDTIYHEHLCYFSASSLIRLCDEVGLSIVRIDMLPVHGGSLRMYAGLPWHYGNHAQTVLALAEDERKAGFTSFDLYEQFAVNVERNRLRLLEVLESLRREEKSIAGYGAPAKANTLLNYCKIDTRLLPFTVDKSPWKVGLFTPGMHIPVLPVATLLEKQPDCVLILAWNFADEIVHQQSEYRARGGRFIIPIPDPKVI